MKVDDLQNYISLFREWLDHRALPLLHAENPALLQNWRDELVAAERLLDEKPELPIAFLGPSQQGKSSLINAIVGENVLPVGAAVGACTCVITSVHHKVSDTYRAEIEFISLDDWAAELGAVEEAATARPADDDTDVDREDREAAATSALEKFDAVYRDVPPTKIAGILNDPALCLPKEIVDAMTTGRPIAIIEEKVQNLRNAIRRYLVGRQQHQDGQFWPLISRVRIFGNFDVLSNGVVLVDLPGLNDPNPAREQVTKRYLQDAQYIWLVCNSQTGIDRVFSQVLRENGFLFRLFLEGRLDVFSVIATRVDDINLQAILEQMGRDPDCFDGDHRPVLAYRRKEIAAHVQDGLTTIAEDIVAKAGPSEHQAAFFDRIAAVPVFAISTAAYLHAIGKMPLYQGMKLSPEESHVPGLIDHLHTITLEQSYKTQIEASFRRLQMLHKQASRFFLDRVQRIETDSEAARREWSEFIRVADQGIGDSKNAMKSITMRADVALQQRRRSFEEKLAELDAKAVRNLAAVFSEWQAINWRTLRSAVERNGSWYSVALHREFDFNRDVARAYLDLIPFIWDDFFGAQLAGLTDEVVSDSREELHRSAERIKGAMAMLRNQPDGIRDSMEASLATAGESFKLQAGQVRSKLSEHIQRTRQEMATGMVEAAKSFMQPAYLTAAKELGGIGIKKRMLETIMNHARLHGPKLFITIRQELAEGVVTLESSMKPQLAKIVTYGTGVLDQFRQNTLNHQVIRSDQLGAFRVALELIPNPRG